MFSLMESRTRALTSSSSQTAEIFKHATPTDRVGILDAQIVGLRDNAGALSINTYRKHVKWKNDSGVLTLGTVRDVVPEDEDVAAWSVTVSQSGTDLVVTVNGGEDSVTWFCMARVDELSL